ncbi:hypothetical protein D3C73_1419750 [compost metagenome]
MQQQRRLQFNGITYRSGVRIKNPPCALINISFCHGLPERIGIPLIIERHRQCQHIRQFTGRHNTDERILRHHLSAQQPAAVHLQQ